MAAFQIRYSGVGIVGIAFVLSACGGGGGGSNSSVPLRVPGPSVYLTAMPPGANGNSAGGVPGGTDPSKTQYPANFADSLALYGDLAYAKVGLTAPGNCTGPGTNLATTYDRPPNNAGEHQTVSQSACNYFKHEGLLPDTIPAMTGGRGTRPNPESLTYNGKNAKITRDGWGVPYITADDRASAEFAMGYAQAEDRLWFFDVIRNVGRGLESEFLGPFSGAYDMDSSYASLAGYSEDELTEMLTGNAAKGILGAQQKFDASGAGLGTKFLADIDAFVAGFNQYISDLQGSKSNEVPPEYTSLKPGGFPPRPWNRNDIVASAILIQAFFAGGGGGEIDNELLLQKLASLNGESFGGSSIPTKTCQEWRDLRHADDPEAIRTIDRSFPTQSLGAEGVSEQCPQNVPTGAVIWDAGSYHPFAAIKHVAAPGIAAVKSRRATVLAKSDSRRAGSRQAAVQAASAKSHSAFKSVLTGTNPLQDAHIALAESGLGVPNTTSNFIGVTAVQTADGYPITVMGPQTGYFDPQLLWEVSMVSNGGTPFDFHGRGAVTANLPYIELGRGIDYAWSATSGESDLIDIRVSKLCNTNGTAVPAGHPELNFDDDRDGYPDADGYLYSTATGSACRKLYKRKDTWMANPTGASTASGGSSTPDNVGRYVLRTHYGPVLATALVSGQPVVISIQRSTFFGEVDTAVPFALVSTESVNGIQSFQKLFNSVTGTFNWLYVDKNDIGYIHSGLYPLRAKNIHPELPAWGDGTAEWLNDQGLNDAFFSAYGGTATSTTSTTPNDPNIGLPVSSGALAFPGRAIPQWQLDPSNPGYFEWPNFLPLSQHPQDINPAKGWITSWNNSPAKGWSAADGMGSWGPIHRADMLGRRLAAFQASGQKFNIANMIEVMGDAAYTDLRGMEVLPLLLSLLNTQATDPNGTNIKTLADLGKVTALMQSWIDQSSSEAWIGPAAHGLGAMRRDRSNTPGPIYDQRAQVVLMDAWYPHLIDTVLPQLTALDTGTNPVSVLQARYDAPRGQGSAYQEGYYEPMKRVLQMALSTSTNPYLHPYNILHCADATLAGCRAAVLSALDLAVGDLGGLPANWDGKPPAAWDGTKLSSNPSGCSPGMNAGGCGGTGHTVEAYDAVVHSQVSLLPMATIHWINRPTFQQAIQIKKDRTEP